MSFAGAADIQPGIGLGPLRLGMTGDEAAELLGAPVCCTTRGVTANRFSANDIAVAFQDNCASGVSAGRRAKGVAFMGHDVFALPSQIILRLFLDTAAAREAAGILVFPALWLMLSGLHDEDPDHKAIVIESFADWPRGFERARRFRLNDEGRRSGPAPRELAFSEDVQIRS
jgi:hypothetical protein